MPPELSARGMRVAVAYSGGRDSTALLHATVAAAGELGIAVVALHVHHGLSPHADAWLAHCAMCCARWTRRGLPLTFEAHRLVGGPERGDSIEAWAREARYEALGRMALARDCTLVLLAHHRRDQAETLLLQALRGAGVAGLSAMPDTATRRGITWVRPWLDRPRADIEAYVRRHRLRHIDDASNDDRRHARNRLRLDVWPALTAAFPHAEAALALAAGWAQQAADVLAELAALDLADVSDADGLCLGAWQALSTARRSNALRAWLMGQLGRPATASLVERLAHELVSGRNGARWLVDGGELRRQRGRLVHADAAGVVVAATPNVPRESVCSVRRAGSYLLPGWCGRLEVKRVASGGVPLASLDCLELRPRAGAERFQAGPGRPARSLKKQFQAAGVRDGERAGPLIYAGGRLIYVPGLGIDARAIGLPGQALVALHWEPTLESPAFRQTAPPQRRRSV